MRTVLLSLTLAVFAQQCAADEIQKSGGAQPQTSVTGLANDIREIHNDVTALAAALGAPATIRVEHDKCAGIFATDADKKHPGISFIQIADAGELKGENTWHDVEGFQIGYGERALFKPVGKMHFGDPAGHPAQHPSGSIKFTRKIGDHTGPEVRYFGNNNASDRSAQCRRHIKMDAHRWSGELW